MVTRNYSSATAYDKSLVLEIFEEDDGRQTYGTYKGFRTLKEAQDFVEWWEDLYSWGYNGSASVNADFTVNTVRWNSCD
jgi:hypothetical protein